MRTLLAAAIMGMATTAMAGVRDTLDLNFGWQFHAAEGRHYTDINDGWQTVDVPHDFQIAQPWVAPGADEGVDLSDPAANIKSRLSSRGFKEMGEAWYVRRFDMGDELRGRRLLLDFEGIMLVGDVYLNGERIGGTDYGYVGFEIDITGKTLPEGNVLAVKASTMDATNSRWYTGGGLFRPVRMIVTDADRHFNRHPLYITTPEVSSDEATVHTEVEMTIPKGDRQVTLCRSIVAPDGQVVLSDTATLARGHIYIMPDVSVPNPQLWSCETPALYDMRLTMLDAQGHAIDEANHKFGIRTLEYDPSFGFKLNGKKVLLKGIANHHTLGALGAAAYDRAILKRLQLLKSYGVNHVRTSHNPYSVSLLDMCDSLGILVCDELYDKWLTQYAGGRRPWQEIWQDDINEWMRRDRNHPCVVMWSLGNELQTYPQLPYHDGGVTPYLMQKPVVKRLDPTRPVTVAMHPRGRNPQTDSLPCDLAKLTDIQAYNYRYMYFPGDRQKFPYMNFYQSEATVSAMGPNWYEMELDKVVGLAYWGMIDYLGESDGWPAKGWNKGCFDISLEPKPQAYLLKSMFTEEPTVHIGVVESDKKLEWNGAQVGTMGMSEIWNRPEGSRVDLYTYTNAEEVELLLNGKSLGVQKNPDDAKGHCKIRWNKVEYKAGRLEAVARTGGKVVARHALETTGEAVKLVAQPDNQAWRADGTDLQHVRLVAVDKKGRQVRTAQGVVSFHVEGDASIVAVTNGDHNSNEMYVATERSLYNGTVTVILRAGRTSGPVTLTATCDGLKTAVAKMDTK